MAPRADGDRAIALEAPDHPRPHVQKRPHLCGHLSEDRLGRGSRGDGGGHAPERRLLRRQAPVALLARAQAILPGHLLGHVLHRPHVPRRPPGPILGHRIAVAVDDPDRSVGADDAADDVDGGGRLDAGGDGELDPLAIVRVDRCEEHVEALDGVLRQAEDAGELDRPFDLTGVDLPGPAPDGGDALRLRQMRFAAGEALGRVDALGDVLEHPPDARRMPLVVAVDDLAAADDVPDRPVRPHDPVLDLVLVALARS